VVSNLIEITAGDVVVLGHRGEDYIEVGVVGHASYEPVGVPLSEVPFLLEAIRQVADFVGVERG